MFSIGAAADSVILEYWSFSLFLFFFWWAFFRFGILRLLLFMRHERMSFEQKYVIISSNICYVFLFVVGWRTIPRATSLDSSLTCVNRVDSRVSVLSQIFRCRSLRLHITTSRSEKRVVSTAMLWIVLAPLLNTRPKTLCLFLAGSWTSCDLIKIYINLKTNSTAVLHDFKMKVHGLTILVDQ